jgi:hypothetical protein
VALLRVNDAVWVGLGAEVALQAKDEDREGGFCWEGRADLFDPLSFWCLVSMWNGVGVVALLGDGGKNYGPLFACL